ncbi:hypothetical protein BP6252_11777 [Coleophoma cylindrospora]|uniref:Uncharacterized protein n=1 Tax=Coleophoma cylindrospora TaxID=1849047 RepID=A0A3D8QLK7_9HELO|nr:hypothetical protein BP6252_11777 [Coleophoma cylindrospora]
MVFGRAHGSQEAKLESFRLYGEALPKLRAAVEGIKQAWDFSTLVLITMLSMYELVSHRAGFGWGYHAQALATMIELRGPWRHKKFPEKSVFLEHRMILLSQAICSRRKSFLARKIWKEVPWEDDLASKQPIDYLLDILCDISGLIEDIDRAERVGRAYEENLDQLIIQSFRDINKWWQQWEAHIADSCEEVTTDPKSTIMVDEDGILFPTLFEYKNFFTAYTTCIYNAVRIQLLLLWEILTRAAPHTAEPQLGLDEPNNTPLLGITSDARGLAREIFQSLEYCHLQSKHHFGTFCLLFPVDFAYGSLGLNSRESRWLLGNNATEFARFGGYEPGTMNHKLVPQYRFNVPQSGQGTLRHKPLNENTKLNSVVLD